MPIVFWLTRNIKSFFPLKDKVVCRSWIVYERQCSCKFSYIGETKRSSEVCWKEHKDPAEKSETTKHLIENASQKFTWKALSAAPSYFYGRKILEVSFIILPKLALNDQLEHHSFSLFYYGIT